MARRSATVGLLSILTFVQLGIFPCSAATNSVSLRTTAATRTADRYLKKHQYQQAQSLYQRELQRDPHSFPAQIGLAQSLLNTGKYNEALAQVESAAAELATLPASAQTAPWEMKLHLVRGQVLHELQQFDKAEAELNTAITASPTVEALCTRADNSDAQGKTELAIKDLSAAIKMDSSDADRFLQRALLYKQIGDQDKALTDLNTAVQLQPGLVTWRASFQRDAGKNEQALEDYSHAIDLQSGSDKASQYFNRGAVYEDLDQHRRAIADFTDAIKINPKSPAYYTHRGTSYYGVCDFNKAIDDFTHAIAMDPNNGDYYFRRANAKQAEGHHADALVDYDKAIALAPDKHAIFYLKRAELRSELNDHQGALSDLSKAIEISGGAPDYYYARGHQYIVTSDWRKAAADLTMYIEKNSCDPAGYRARAMARTNLADKPGALEDLKHATELYKNEGDLHGAAEVNRMIRQLNQE